MRWALSSGSSRVAVSLRRATDCGQNPGGFSGLEPELLHSRLTATERLWLIYADVLIDHRQLSPGRPASLLSKIKKEEEGQINKRGETSCVFTPQTKRPPSEGGGRLHIRLADLFDFVWHFLFMRLFIFSSRLFPSEEIQQLATSNTIVTPKTLGEHHHCVRSTVTGETDLNGPRWRADPQETAAEAPLHVGFLPPVIQNVHRGFLFIVSAIELHWCSTIVPSGED